MTYLGGARPKAQVIDRQGRIANAKFPKAEGDDWDVTGWEAVALSLARDAGIDAAASELTDVVGRSVHVVNREGAAAILAEVTEATSRRREVARRFGLDRSSIAEMRPAFER